MTSSCVYGHHHQTLSTCADVHGVDVVANGANRVVFGHIFVIVCDCALLVTGFKLSEGV